MGKNPLHDMLDVTLIYGVKGSQTEQAEQQN